MPPRKRCSIPVKDCGPPAKRNFDVSDMSSDSNDSCSDPVFAEYIDSVKKKCDAFCWSCHKKCNLNGEIQCSKCGISFHVRCVHEEEQDDWECPECENIEECLNEEGEMVGLEDLLKCATERIILNVDDFETPDGYESSSLLVNPITIAKIVEKARDDKYPCTYSFLLDFKWLLHNCIILNNQIKGPGKEQFNNARIVAKKLVDASKYEISDLKGCRDCYINRGDEDLFLEVCSKPHLLLWVRFGGHPYWPAKLMNIGKGPRPIEVQFFGEWSQADVTSSSCLLYSSGDPNEDLWCSDVKRNKFNKAVNDAYKHIMEIEKKFGPFQFAKPKTRLVTANIEKHLDDMIPGYRDPSQRPPVEQNDDGDSNFASAAPNELLQQGWDIPNKFGPQNLVKSEPNDDRDDENGDVTSSGLRASDTTDQNNHIQVPPALAGTLAGVQEYIKHLENELQKKDEQLEAQRRQLQESIAESNAKLVDAKKKQWCSDCQEQVETEHHPMCTTCSLMN